MNRQRPPSALGYAQSLNSQLTAATMPGASFRATLRSLGLWAIAGAVCFIAATVWGPYLNRPGIPGSLAIACVVMLLLSLIAYWGISHDASRFAVRERRRRTAFLRACLTSPSPQRVEAAIKELESRRAQLGTDLRGSDFYATACRTRFTHPLSVKLAAAASVSVFAFILVPIHYSGLKLLCIFMQFPLLLAGFVVAGRSAYRITRSIGECRCPDCGYSLVGVPSGLASLGDQRNIAGPARCPECGSPWPLVPPALHA